VKVVILAGGKGTRISETKNSIPKPLVKIGSKPIIHHIMHIFAKQGFNDFIVAGGYKYEMLKKYFSKNKFPKSWKINVINTGTLSMTGGRIFKLKKILNNDFFCTYGDGIANVNLKKILSLHKKAKTIGTITAVRPPARFGEIIIKKNLAVKFKEKPQTTDSWINGGFFILSSKFFKYLKSSKDILEEQPLEKLSKEKQLSVYKHYDQWFCMDTPRDKDVLNKLYRKGKLNWIK
tara:strand:+ start:25 stop:726 length:702 start_codon:yes stop_codon:yes gene_type:complete